MIGRTLAHYRIDAAIGAGGMGEVYRAADTKLGRNVALKVLPPEVAGDPDRLARFQREARAVAALNHPNVVTLYSVEESDGVHFLTMELIEGQPLDHLISSNGLPADRLIEIAGAIAEALAAAHEKGIVHRDLKPANVMLTNEGRVKVLDFGLAKDISAESSNDATMTSAGRTQAGMVMGTPSYMSPEQVSGRTLDHRTDIFSLGVLLHEMATGQRPFTGASSAELISSILRDTPASVSELRTDLPSDLVRVIRRCLEKDPRHRMQTARDVSNEFRDLARTTSRPTPHSTPPARISVAADSGAARAGVREDEGFWVAVLPFKYVGSNTDLNALADGLTDDILTGFSKFSYLRVIARSSTARYSHQAVDVRVAAKELGARYVMEGSIRQAGTKIRIAVQMADASSGAGLWAETYDRSFQADTMLELLDDVVPRIVSTVADTQGVLPHSMTDALRNRDPETLTPYEAVLRSFGHHQRVNAAEHLAAKIALEHAVKQPPARADCWASLAWLYREEHTHGFNLQPDPLGRALAASRRALDAGPNSHLAHAALASTLFFLHDMPGFRAAAERAIALNPLEGYTNAYLGMLIAYGGDWDRGCALADRAMQLNPNHPGWYWFPRAFNAYRQRDYTGALETALKVNMPGFWRTQLLLAAANGQLGKREAAGNAIQELLRIRPNFKDLPRDELKKWHDEELKEHLLEGLRKAGLEISDAAQATSTGIVRTSSGETRAAVREDEGFWVAVLPFKHPGSNPDLKVLAEGLSEEIITGLSRFSYLRVIARGSTAKYSSESSDVRTIGKELNARYVMEGSLRQAGGKLRLAVQLIDTSSGAHLWAENYERTFGPDVVFELQDDLVPRIVSTVADMNGVLPRSMSEGLRNRSPEQLTPYEAVLRSFAYTYSATPKELTAARLTLEETVRKSPAYSDAWAMLSFLCGQDYVHGYELQANALEVASSAARRAVALGPSNHLAYFSLGQALWCQKDYDSFRDAAERAVTLNPMDGNSVAYLGELLTYAGSAERGMELVARAKQLNPNHPGWYWFADFYHAFSQGDYRAALAFALKAKLRGNPLAPMFLAAACGQLGDVDGGANALADLLRFRPELPAAMRKQVAKVWNAEYGERFLGGLRKAGMEIPEAEVPASGKIPISVPGSPKRESGATRSAIRENEGFWVAVLPFKTATGDVELEALADGLSEDVTTGLARFPYLQVIAHNSALAYKGRAVDMRTLGRELGARYVMEGGIRRRGRAIRVSAQLMDAATGTQLWAETYDRELGDPQDGHTSTFQIQDDLTDHIVTGVADGHGVLVRSMAAPTRDRKVEELSASELVLRYYAFMQQVEPQEHAALRSGFERALERESNHSVAWACLSNLYALEYGDGFNPRQKPIDRARDAAWRAVKIDPACQMGWKLLSVVHFFSRDFTAFREAAERAISLNPRDGTTLAYVGIMMAYSGDWERGVAMVQRAINLNRHHPGWYYNAAWAHHYRKGEYEAALLAAKKISMPEYHWFHIATAAAAGMLGRYEEARTAIESLRKYSPAFLDLENVREEIARWDPDEDEVERLMQGLQKAGLKYASAKHAGSHTSASQAIIKTDSAPVRAALREDEGFWVAVLPFKYAGGNADLKSLADGLTEEIITGLSRFSYLRVIARGSTARFTSESTDVRAIGKELGARYVMEASLRHAASKLRLTVQLVDAATGSHVWAETYERTFNPETVFALQDELVPRIVSTVADAHGILPHTLGESIRSKNPEQLSPYEAVLRCFGYAERVSAEEHAITRAALEQAVQTAPNYAYGWALLSLTIKDEFESGFNPKPDPLERMLKAARRAIDLDPSGHRGFHALAIAHFYRKEIPAFRTAADRAIALNPMDGCNVAHLGSFIAYAGEWERGCGLVERALQLNPNHPGWFWFPLSMNAYRKGDYQAALGSALKINLPNFLWTHTMLAAIYGQLGQQAEAGKAVQELLKLNPQTAQVVGRALHARFNPDLVDLLIEGLRKAGLDIGGQSVSGSEVSEKDAALSTRASNVKSVAPVARSSGVVRAVVREDEGFWVAVLPFKYTGESRDLKALADGLSEEIITGLSRFSYLHVIARGSTAKYSSESGDIRAIGKELGARYVMEGTLRQAGATLRIAVQLVDTITGVHLWAQTYERALRAEDVFAVQDDITDRVVATVADANGVLVRSIAAGVEEKPEAALTALDWMLRCFSYRRNVSPEAHAKLRDGLERFVEHEPKHADGWACLALAYLDEFSFGFNTRPDALGRALAAARQSVTIDRACQMGNQVLAQAHFFRKDIPAFRAATEEAIALNPRNTEALAQMAMFYVFIREFERGVNLARRAMDLNPKHAGWYHVPLVWDYFQKGEYELALDHEARINIPGLFWQPLAVAACCGLLGRHAEAAAAAQELRQLDKDIEKHLWRHIEIYNYASGFMDRILEGLAKAGLRITVLADVSQKAEKSELRKAETGTTVATSTQTLPSGHVASRTASGEARIDEGFWIAVLPFKYTGSNAELEALAEGLTEEVITGMSRFSYLRVIARGSTVKYSGESGDVRAIGKELGARYVMEGSLRQAGSKLRLAVQLVDTVSGAHLWAETYEHAFTPESVFEVQDDLVPRVVSTVADQYGVLPRSMSDALRSKSEDALTPHEAVLRTFSYFTRLTPEEHAIIRGILERTVREAPDHADSWAMLSMIYRGEFAQGYNVQPNPLDRALAAAQRAVDLSPTHALGRYALATVHFFRKEMIPFRVAAEKALALNPLDASVRAYLGLLIASAGEWDKGCEMVESAMRLNPNCPGYFYFARCWDNYRRGNYEETLKGVAATNTPNYFHVPAIQAAALAQLGRREEAQKAVEKLLELRPDFASAARQEYAKWYDDEHVEQVLEGLRKAGLEIP